MLNEISNLSLERDTDDNLCIIDNKNRIITTEIDCNCYILKSTGAMLFDINYMRNYINENMEGLLALYDLIYGTDITNVAYSYSYMPDEDYRYMEVHADRIYDIDNTNDKGGKVLC